MSSVGHAGELGLDVAWSFLGRVGRAGVLGLGRWEVGRVLVGWCVEHLHVKRRVVLLLLHCCAAKFAVVVGIGALWGCLVGGHLGLSFVLRGHR